MDEIITEMRQVSRRGARYIWFVDDNFRLGKHDLEEFCRKLIDADLDVSWMTFVRAGVLENTDVMLLARAGCIEVQLGLESADQQILKNMNKKATPQLYETVIRRLLAAGISCTGYLIFGFPGENEASVRRTIAFMQQFDGLREAGSIAWSFFPFVLAPLSPIFEPAMRESYQIEGYMRKWQHATMNSSQAMQHVMQAFFAVETSGSVYRSDNQDDLRRMTSGQRHDFQRTRHRLAQQAARTVLTREEILRAFHSIV
jgi:p-methyltransferase